jgi:DNA-binding transcriptional LysR family regulator
MSFSKAARELRIAQSAVSRQIKLLEESMAQQLIVRSPQSMVLTRLGQELYLALSDFDRNIQRLVAGEERPELRIGLLHGVLETWLTGVISRQEELLRYNLSIQVDRPDLLLEGLLERRYDLVITNENLQTELVSSLKLFDEELVVISTKKIDPARIKEQRWITYARSDWLHRVYRDPEHKDFIQVNSMTAVVRLVRSGAGIAIVPTHLLDDRSGLHIEQVPLSKQPSVYLSTLNYTYLPPTLKPLLDLLREEGRSMGRGSVTRDPARS